MEKYMFYICICFIVLSAAWFCIQPVIRATKDLRSQSDQGEDSRLGIHVKPDTLSIYGIPSHPRFATLESDSSFSPAIKWKQQEFVSLLTVASDSAIMLSHQFRQGIIYLLGRYQRECYTDTERVCTGIYKNLQTGKTWIMPCDKNANILGAVELFRSEKIERAEPTLSGFEAWISGQRLEAK